MSDKPGPDLPLAGIRVIDFYVPNGQSITVQSRATHVW